MQGYKHHVALNIFLLIKNCVQCWRIGNSQFWVGATDVTPPLAVCVCVSCVWPMAGKISPWPVHDKERPGQNL